MLYRDGEELSLPPKAVETLGALIAKSGEIVGKEDLIREIWTDTIVEESNLAHYLHILRKTFGNRADGKPYIETLRRRGYRFNPVGEVTREFQKNAGDKERNDFNAPVFEKESFWKNDLEVFISSANSSSKSHRRTNARFMLAAFIGTLIFGTLFFVYYQRFSGTAENSPAKFKEMSVINLTDNSGIYSANISRDGKYFTYFEFKDKKYHLYLQQTGQPSRLEIIPPTENLVTGSTFSPNGEFIYFVGVEGDNLHGTLYRVPTLGGKMSEVLKDIVTPVSFSPDGSEMVFARYSEESRASFLIIASADGSRERILYKPDAKKTLANGGTWSPDGKAVAFSEIDQIEEAQSGRYSILGVDVQSGETRTLSREKWENCFRMDWTRDGEGLVFIGTRAGEGLSVYRDQVYYLSTANGESKRITNGGNLYDSETMTTTNDNALIAVSVNRHSQIYKTSTADLSNSEVRLTNGQADGRGGIAPVPGERLGFISRNGENLGIWTMNADGSERRQVFNEFSFLEELRATPDGKYFIFAAQKDGLSHLYRIDYAGGNLKQLTDGKSTEVDSTVSPDSRWVFYVSDVFDGENRKKQLRKTSIDGSETVVICDVNGETPNLSPDGKLISLVENNKLKIYSAQNGELLKTLEALKPGAFYTGAKWMPDGKSLVYPVADDKDVLNLWQQPLDGSPPRRLTKFNSGSIYFHAFADDGKTLYLARGEQIRNALLIKNFK
ncbi:MAG: DPP IV N-terminal domain-containing protein [Pyrinomonadaceae bacterium]|nr:DPP IV N-terminal domain-containing protein [Pyrinomonadaceae bacterium]